MLRRTWKRWLPRVCLGLMTIGAAFGADIFVAAGGDLQAALDAAQLGDTVTLQAGSVFTGNYIASPKTGSGWITIQTSSAELRARVGTRVSPSDAPQMAAIVAPFALPGLIFHSVVITIK